MEENPKILHLENPMEKSKCNLLLQIIYRSTSRKVRSLYPDSTAHVHPNSLPANVNVFVDYRLGSTVTYMCMP